MASGILETFGESISFNPVAFSNSLSGFMHLKNKRNLVLVSNDKDEILNIIHIINDNFNPFLSYLAYFKDSNLEEINKNLEYYSAKDGKVTAYLCENNTCHEPVDAEKLKDLLYN